MNHSNQLPTVVDPDAVGTYARATRAGGGFVWDEVLEYRVWFSARIGAEGDAAVDDFFRAFATAQDALEAAERSDATSAPVALVLQREYIDEPLPGKYVHIVEERVTEWPLSFLGRPRRTAATIPDFLAADPTSNRLAVLRGLT